MALQLPTPDDLAALTDEERAEMAAVYLATLQPGRQPLPLFTQFGRLVALSTVEIVPLRRREDGRLEVLLTQRSPSDPWWPNQWHIPGAVVLHQDMGDAKDWYSYEQFLARLCRDELGEAIEVGQPHFFDARLRRTERGIEQTAFCWAEVSLKPGYDKPAFGRFFDAATVVKQQPEGGFLTGHDETIRRAVAHYNVFHVPPSNVRRNAVFFKT